MMVGGFIRRKFGEAKASLTEELASRKEARMAETAAFREERLKQRTELGKQRAQLQTQERLQQLKTRSKAGPLSALSGLAGGLNKTGAREALGLPTRAVPNVLRKKRTSKKKRRKQLKQQTARPPPRQPRRPLDTRQGLRELKL
jgi:hypothetical protein